MMAPILFLANGGNFDVMDPQAEIPVVENLPACTTIDVRPRLSASFPTDHDVEDAKRLIRYYSLANWYGQEQKRKVYLALLGLVRKSEGTEFYCPKRRVSELAGVSDYTSTYYLRELRQQNILVVVYDFEQKGRRARTYWMDLRKEPRTRLCYHNINTKYIMVAQSRSEWYWQEPEKMTFGLNVKTDLWRDGALGGIGHHIWCWLWNVDYPLSVAQLSEFTGNPECTVRLTVGKMIDFGLVAYGRDTRPYTYRVHPDFSWETLTNAEKTLGVFGMHTEHWKDRHPWETKDNNDGGEHA